MFTTSRRPPSWIILLGLLALLPRPIHGQTPRLDLHGDPLPDGVVLRLGTTRFRVPDAGEFTLPRNGKWIVVSGRPGMVLDAFTGKRLLTTGPAKFPDHLSLSNDDRWLLVLSETLDVWDMTTFKKVESYPVKVKGGDFNVAAISSDGASIAYGFALDNVQHVHVFARKSPKTLKKLETIRAGATRLEFSRDGKRLFANALDGTNTWDLASGKLLRQEKDFAFHGLSPDGSLMILGPSNATPVDPFGQPVEREGTVRLRPADDLKAKPREFKVPGHMIRAVALSPDNKTLIVSSMPFNRGSDTYETQAHQFEVTTGKKAQAPEALATMYCLRFSHDGKLLVGRAWNGHASAIQFWDRATGAATREFGGHTGAVHEVQFLPDGKSLVSLGYDGMARVWSLESGRELRRAAANGHSLAVAPDGSRAAWIGPGFLSVWDFKEEKPATSRFLVFDPRAAVISPDSRWLTIGTGDGALQEYDVATGDFRRTMANIDFGGPSDREALDYAPDGSAVACASGNALRIVDSKNGKERFQLVDEETRPFLSCRYSPDGHVLATCSDQRAVHVWDIAKKTSRLLWQPTKGPQKVGEEESSRFFTLPLSYSRDGALLASGHADGKVRIWEALSLQLVCEFAAHEGHIESVRFSPSGQRVATSSAANTDVLLWDLPTLLKAPRPTTDDWRSLWADTIQNDAVKGQRAVARLIQAGPDIVPFLLDRLKETLGQNANGMDRVSDLLEELDAPAFDRREKAQRELTEMGLRVLPIIRKQVTEQSSLEVRRRMERLVRSIEDKSEKQRWHLRRVVQVLEALDTTPARAQLKKLAAEGHEKDMVEAALTRMAKRTFK